MTQYKPENPGDYKHSTVFASYTRIISLYGAIRFKLSGYSRSIEFSIKDSICKKMSSNCSSVVPEMSVEICSSCWLGPYLSWVGRESTLTRIYPVAHILHHPRPAWIRGGYLPRNVEYFAFILSSEVLQHRLVGQ